MNDTLKKLLYLVNKDKYCLLYDNINFTIHIKILYCGLECDGSLLSFNTTQGSIQIKMHSLEHINFISSGDIETITLHLMDNEVIKLVNVN